MEGFAGTVLLALTTIILIIIISIPLGIFPLHIAIEFLTFSENLFFYWCIYAKFLGRIDFIIYFGLKLGLFPIATASVTPSGLVLPALTLAIYQSAKYTRQVRTVI